MTISQLQLFIIFIFNGILIGFIFDFFRILRKTFKHKNIAIYLQDILFWILTAILLLYSSFSFNNGKFRIYMLLAVALGFIIYLYTLSKIFIKISVYIITALKKATIILLKILLIPLKYIMLLFRKVFLKPCTFLVINARKSIKTLKMSKKKKIKEGF